MKQHVPKRKLGMAFFSLVFFIFICKSGVMLLCAATHFSKLRRAGKWVVCVLFFPELWRDVETMMWAFTSRASGAALLLQPACTACSCCPPSVIFPLFLQIPFMLSVVNVAAIVALLCYCFSGIFVYSTHSIELSVFAQNKCASKRLAENSNNVQ